MHDTCTHIGRLLRLFLNMYRNRSGKEVEIFEVTVDGWNSKGEGDKEWDGQWGCLCFKVEVATTIEISWRQNFAETSCDSDQPMLDGLCTSLSWLMLLCCYQ